MKAPKPTQIIILSLAGLVTFGLVKRAKAAERQRIKVENNESIIDAFGNTFTEEEILEGIDLFSGPIN
jgi:hypothetical protein